MSTRTDTDNTFKIVLIILAAIVLAPVLMMALAVPMFGMWGGMMGGGSGVAPLWGLGMALFWVVILVGAGYLIYRAAVGSGPGKPDPAIEELRLAYARGEVSEEEFEHRREKLGPD